MFIKSDTSPEAVEGKLFLCTTDGQLRWFAGKE